MSEDEMVNQFCAIFYKDVLLPAKPLAVDA